ncbi:unnamed protein product [Phyllotreta striolata]|uniref:Uncharacterized protein n=1 Tax=Phyllotreta striolata TaxID=444603 RepID=A0A9N9XIR5_PHYSR|nr:unnamed protein product [Phyllotreta striolata]
MTRCFVYYLFICIYFHNVHNLDVNRYLDSTLGVLKDIKGTAIDPEDIIKNGKNEILLKLYQENSLHEINSTIKMISMFNQTHIFTKTGIFYLNNNLSIFSYQNGDNMKKFEEFEKLTLFKGIEFGEIGFVIINFGFTGDSYIYQFTNNRYNLIQTLWTPDASDVHFFMNNNNLYLLVVNNKGDSLVQTSIYKWLGFHFDEIQTVFTTGAIKVESFTTRTAEIIIILQDIPNKALPAAVFKFNNDEIKKIQLLDIHEGMNLVTHINRGKIFVLIFGSNKTNLVYVWNGYQLVLVNKFQTEEAVANFGLYRVNNRSLLEIPLENNLQIYEINNEIELLQNIQYQSNLSKIADILIAYDGTTYIAGFDDNNVTKIIRISLTYNFTNSEETTPSRDVLRNCYKNMEFKVDLINKKLDSIKIPDGNSSYGKTEQNDAKVKRAAVQESVGDSQIKNLESWFSRVNSSASNYKFENNSNITINGNVIFKKIVSAAKLEGHNILLKSVNKRKWVPEQWLRYEKPQTISGLSKLKTVVANYFETSPLDPLFKDLLLKNKNQEFTKFVSINSLTVPKIYLKTLNNISMEVYSAEKLGKIEGIHRLINLNVDHIITRMSQEPSDEIVSSPNFDLNSNITIENLTVETINGIRWEEFKNSVFRINLTKEIEGPLTFSEIKTKHLVTKKIKDTDANDLFTTTTDQIIESNMKFSHIFTKELNVETVNGIRIPEDVVLLNETTTIEGPVIMNKVEVLGNWTKSENISFLRENSDIVDKIKSDQLQIYSGNVTINGNLYVPSLSLLPAAKLMVSDNEVNSNFGNIYWTKNTHQKIPVNVNFLQGISTPHLLTKVLNNVKIDQYMLNNNAKNLETDFEFENVTVTGDVLLRAASQHKPNLDDLLKTAVLNNGSYIIHGKKTYSNTLKVKNLQTNELQGIKVSEAVNKRWNQNITGTKILKHLIVKNGAFFDIDGLETINDVSLKEFLEKTIFIDRPENISQLDFDSVTVNHLKITNLNNHNIKDYISFQQKLQNISSLKNLIVKGNLQVNDMKLEFLNDIPFSVLLKLRPTTENNTIINDVEFAGNIHVKNLIAQTINDIDWKNLTARILNRHYPQIIPAHYTFSNIKSKNIFTNKINEVIVEGLIDTSSTSSQKIYQPNAPLFLSSITSKYLEASKIAPCSLDAINELFNDPPTKNWNEISIKGHVTALDDESILHRLFEKTVKLNSKNTIHAEVNFSSHVLIKNVHMHGLLNGVNIPYLLNDAILKNSAKEQEITGKKHFNALVTKSANVLGNVETTFLNNEDVNALNNDIVDKNGDKIIKGKKTFYGGVQANRFNSKTINGVDPEDIVNLDYLKPIPEATFDTVEITGEFNFNSYNGRNFTDFLEKRLLTNSPHQVATGMYFFEHLESQNFTTPSINNIKIDEMVFDIDTQEIFGSKQFKQPLAIHGNVTIDFVNGVNLSYEFANSIPLEGQAELIGNVFARKPVVINGSINTNSINGIQISTIKGILTSNTTKTESEKIFLLKQQIIKKIQRSLPLIESLPTVFMYLEKSDELQVTVPNALSASTIESNGFVLIQVNGQESGRYCGLPNHCSCPVQYTIEITPHNSVSVLPNKGFQRIFSYNDESVFVNFITNSISTSSECRTNRSKVFNEVSMLTWNTKTQGNEMGQFFHYDKFLSGYISKVVFFTSDEETYAVIGRYYDPVADTYNLNCSVLKFSKNKTRMDEIQVIPTKGLQEVYVFQTAQGVVLVLGSKTPFDVHHKEEETQIYRFNNIKGKFDYLRTVPSFGCSNAVGITQGSDSLIALTHREAPVQVLKYDPVFDTYYYYQTIDLGELVVGISSFYVGGFGISDVYLCLVTSHENYYIYTYRFLEGLVLKSKGNLEGLQDFVPFEHNNQSYLFVPSTNYSSLLTVVTNGAR